MTKKILLDVDPGIVDAAALVSVLRCPDVEVVAVTSVGGVVSPAVAARNTHSLIEYLDPPRIPRFGVGSEPDEGLPGDLRHIHGNDGLGDVGFPTVAPRNPHPAEKVICEVVHNHPHQVLILALGPLTNIARAFQRDPELPSLVEKLYISGGTVDAPGNITASAEFNMFCDPVSAKFVLRTPCHTVMIPLDVTSKTLFTLNHFGQLPAEDTHVGSLLRKILLPCFRTYRQYYGYEGIRMYDLITCTAALHPECMLTKPLPVDVEIQGELTRGMTVFDRRPQPECRNMMDVAIRLDDEAIVRHILHSFQ